MTFSGWKKRGVCAAGAPHVPTMGNHGLENAGSLCHGETETIGGVVMSPLDVADNKVADPHDGTVAYVPPLQRTAGQAGPHAAHCAAYFRAFTRGGAAGRRQARHDAV